MGALTNIYIDPAIAGNSGAGTIGDPYGDLQYALNTATRDATNGNQFNIKEGTDEVLTATLSFATYGTPTTSAPCIIRGYTSAANDGGIGGISGAATYAILNATAETTFADMHLHNCGSAVVLTMGANGCVYNCQVNNSSGNAIACSSRTIVANCYIHDIGAIGIVNTTFLAYGNFLKNGTKTFTVGIRISTGGVAIGNIVVLNTDGIATFGGGVGSIAMNNSIYSPAAGTGRGIFMDADQSVCLNNLVQGFSGAGGYGIRGGSGRQFLLHGNNAVYNCATAYSLVSDVNVDLGNNETLGASPFVNAGGDDFTPVNTGSVYAGSWSTLFPGISLANYRDKGAVQHTAIAGGLFVHPGMSGGMRG